MGPDLRVSDSVDLGQAQESAFLNNCLCNVDTVSLGLSIESLSLIITGLSHSNELAIV